VYWYGIPENTYRYVWLEICKADKSSCGGGFSVSNKGRYYDFRTDASMVGKDWIFKVYTQDRKYTGYSNAFFVDGMLPPCCADGWHIPPFCNE
jgi:hypothetical protein